MTEIGNDAQLGEQRLASIAHDLLEQRASWEAEQERVNAEPATDEEALPG